VVVAVLGAPTRRFSRAELEALRAFLLERGGRLWLLAEGADPAGGAPAAGSPDATPPTNLWHRLCLPLLGVAPRCGEAVVRSAPWPSPPLLVRAAAAALEVAKMQEEARDEEGEGEKGEGAQQEADRGGGGGHDGHDGDDGAAAAVRRAAAALRRVRRAAATSAMCLHPRHALVAMGSAGEEGWRVDDDTAPGPSINSDDGNSQGNTGDGSSSGNGNGIGGNSSGDGILAGTVLNRSLARAFADGVDADGDECDDCAFVFADGCPLDVFVGGGAGGAGNCGGGGGGGGSGGRSGEGAAAAAGGGTATPLLSSGRQCYPADRPLMAAWSQHRQPRGKHGAEAIVRPCGRALVVGSAAAFSDAWLRGRSNGSGGNVGNGNGGANGDGGGNGNRCDGNRRLADWCLRWLSSASASCELHPGDGAAARAAVGVAPPAPPRGFRPSTGRRPPHALAPAVGALACRVGAGGEAAAGGLPVVVMPPAEAMRCGGGGGGDWRAMLDAGAFDGAGWRRGRAGAAAGRRAERQEPSLATAAAELAAEMMRPLG